MPGPIKPIHCGWDNGIRFMRKTLTKPGSRRPDHRIVIDIDEPSVEVSVGQVYKPCPYVWTWRAWFHVTPWDTDKIFLSKPLVDAFDEFKASGVTYAAWESYAALMREVTVMLTKHGEIERFQI